MTTMPGLERDVAERNGDAPRRVDSGVTGSDVSETAVPKGRPAASARPTKARTRRQVVLWAAIGLIGLVLVGSVYELVVTDIVHARRRSHLIADYAVARPKASYGSALATLQIPKIGLNEVVVEGDSVDNLRAGLAHRFSTPPPGQKGNALVLGHSKRYGGPFEKLDRLKKGDEIFVAVKNQPAVRMVVVSSRRVGSDDTRALGQSDDTRLTLVSSAGGLLSTERRVVVAVETDGELAATTGRRGSFDAVGPSPFFNGMVGLAMLALVGAAVAFEQLRSRHRSLVVAVVVLPMVILGALLFALNLDLLLPATL